MKELKTKLCCNLPIQDWTSMLPKGSTICSSHHFVFIPKLDAFASHSIQTRLVVCCSYFDLCMCHLFLSAGSFSSALQVIVSRRRRHSLKCPKGKPSKPPGTGFWAQPLALKILYPRSCSKVFSVLSMKGYIIPIDLMHIIGT